MLTTECEKNKKWKDTLTKFFMNKKINHVAAFQIRMHRKSKVSNNYGIIKFFSPLMLSADSCSFLFLSFFFLSICLFYILSNYIWLISSNLSTTTIMSSTTTTGAHSVRWGVRGWAWVCAGVRGMIAQNIFWRIESLHQRTLIRILYEFLIMISNEIMKYYFLYTRFFWLDLNKIA